VEPYKWLPGSECFLSGDGYRKCYKKYQNEYLVFDVDDRGIRPNPKYDVVFVLKLKKGALVVNWLTSERNFEYWREIQDAVVQHLEEWQYEF